MNENKSQITFHSKSLLKKEKVPFENILNQIKFLSKAAYFETDDKLTFKVSEKDFFKKFVFFITIFFR